MSIGTIPLQLVAFEITSPNSSLLPILTLDVRGLLETVCLMIMLFQKTESIGTCTMTTSTCAIVVKHMVRLYKEHGAAHRRNAFDEAPVAFISHIPSQMSHVLSLSALETSREKTSQLSVTTLG